jgi:hypothetical protein
MRPSSGSSLLFLRWCGGGLMLEGMYTFLVLFSLSQ